MTTAQIRNSAQFAIRADSEDSSQTEISFSLRWLEGVKMVTRLFHKGRLGYICEYCGFGYKDIETSESCEAFCGVHGSCSGKITRLALFAPPVIIIPVTN